MCQPADNDINAMRVLDRKADEYGWPTTTGKIVVAWGAEQRAKVDVR